MSTQQKMQAALFQRVFEQFGEAGNFTIDQLVDKCGFRPDELKGSKGRAKSVPEEHQCCARVWDNSCDNKRCTKRRCGDGDFCAGHGKKLPENMNGFEYVWQKLGRIDQPVPDGYRMAKAPKKTKKSKKDDDGEKKPKKALSAYFCFMNENRQKFKDANPDDKIGDISKKLGEAWKGMNEEDKKPFVELAEKDKIRYKQELEAFQAKVEKQQEVVEAVKEFNQMDTNGDGVIDQEEFVNAMAKTKENEKPVEPVEVVEENDDEDEVTVVEYKYKGTTYLLDPESMKVYNMEQEFVGKLHKKAIDFDAVDSDDEE